MRQILGLLAVILGVALAIGAQADSTVETLYSVQAEQGRAPRVDTSGDIKVPRGVAEPVTTSDFAGESGVAELQAP